MNVKIIEDIHNLLKKDFNTEITENTIDFFQILDRYNNCSISGKALLEDSKIKIYMVLIDDNDNDISDPLEYSGDSLLESEKFINDSFENLKEIYWDLEDTVTGNKYKR